MSNLDLIASSSSLKFKLKLLILLDIEEAKKVFSLNDEEIEQFKSKYFDIKHLPSKIYILDYLEKTGQKELLQYYIYGLDYSRNKLGISEKKDIKEQLLEEIAVAGLESKDIKDKINCYKTLPAAPTQDVLETIKAALTEN